MNAPNRSRRPWAAAIVLAALTAGTLWGAIGMLMQCGTEVNSRGVAQAGSDGGAGALVPRDVPRLPEPRPGPGKFTLSGTVFDAAGNPVAEAVITAEYELGPGTDSLAPAARAALARRRAARSGPRDAEPVRDGGVASDAGARSDASDAGAAGAGILDTTPVVVAVSAADGAFSLIGLDEGRYRLRVEGQGLFTAEVRFVDVPQDGLRLIVARQVAIEGTVVDEAGAPVADVQVGVAGVGLPPVTTRTGADGRFAVDELPEGVFQVWAAAGDRAALSQHVARLGPGPFEPITLALGPAAIARGRVIDRETRRGVAAHVALTATELDEPARYARSDSDGQFVIEGVPLGRWSAAALAPGYVSVESIEFAVGGAFAPEILLTRGGVIAGRVVTRDGTPVVGAVVSARGESDTGRALAMSEDSQARRASAFRGWEPGVGAAGNRFIPRGELGVLLGPIPFPPPRGATALRVAAIVTGDGAAGPGDPDAAGTSNEPAAPIPIAPELEARFITDDQGRYQLTGLTPGRYRVVASHPDYADGRTDPLDLGLGQRRDNADVVLVPGVILVGTVTNTRGELVVGATILADPQVKGTPSAPTKSRNFNRNDYMRSIRTIVGEPEAPFDLAERLQAVTGTDGRYQLGPIAHDLAVRVTAVQHGDVTRDILITRPDPRRPDDDPLASRSVTERVEDFVLPVADAVLSGRVQDAAGFPVRGAQVAIEAPGTLVHGRAEPTDEHGNFAIPALAEGKYRVRVTHPDFPDGAGAGTTGERAAVTLAFGGGVEGEVRDVHTGGPIAGARIQAAGPGGAARETAADADGAIALVPIPAGTWKLTATAPGYVRAERTVSVTAGREPRAVTARDVRIELARGATVAGTVRDHNGVRVRGATVTVGGLRTTTDEDGQFRLRDVPTGDTVIAASRGDARGQITVPLRPGDELVTLEIKLSAAATP